MANFCEKCGCPVTDQNQRICGNCGSPISTTNGNYINDNVNGMATAGFIMAMCSVFVPFLGFICSILGIIFSAIAKKQINIYNERGRGLSTAGLVISIIVCAAWLLLLLILFTAGGRYIMNDLVYELRNLIYMYNY